MWSSYGKEMEGASSDAKEIEGKSLHLTPQHHRLHDETKLPTTDWSSTSRLPCWYPADTLLPVEILPIRCLFLGPSPFIRLGDGTANRMHGQLIKVDTSSA